MSSTSSKANVLVVDDDVRNLQAMQALLEGLAVNVVRALSGDEALRHALRQDFAVILMDARMPGVDGFETARFLRQRERSRHTPIIFLTAAYEDSRSMFRGYEAGAVDYIVKPLVPEVLRSKVQVFVELHHKNAELMREISERKRAAEQLRDSEENLRALAAHLQSVREEECARIAREIHDELGQALTGLKMDLTWLTRRLPVAQRQLAERSKSMSKHIDDAIVAVREIASQLRPEAVDQLGLVAAIKGQAKDFQRRSGIRCKISAPSLMPALDRDRATAAFRIVQELLTNVARHADASRVDVTLKAGSESFLLTVQDNGVGIELGAVHSAKSLGLLGIRERLLPFGGSIVVAGTPGAGTSVKVSIPLDLK